MEKLSRAAEAEEQFRSDALQIECFSHETHRRVQTSKIVQNKHTVPLLFPKKPHPAFLLPPASDAPQTHPHFQRRIPNPLKRRQVDLNRRETLQPDQTDAPL